MTLYGVIAAILHYLCEFSGFGSQLRQTG